MSFFVATELGVANLLHRNFQWSHNNLWIEDMPHARDPMRSLYVIGGKDDIVNAQVRVLCVYTFGTWSLMLS